MRPWRTARHLPAGVPHSLPIPIVMDRRCRLAVDCKLIRNFADGKGKQPWVICSKTDDGEVLARKAKLESAGARIIESDDNGKWPLMSNITSTGLMHFPRGAWGVAHVALVGHPEFDGRRGCPGHRFIR